jgi:histidinol-phosphatase (PHP family)
MTTLPAPLRSNLHAHSTFDDGSLTPQEMVRAAIKARFDVIGISGHVYMGHPTEWCMTPVGTLQFMEEMARLKDRYADCIAVYCGIEQDVLAPLPEGTYDYIIGACHAVEKEGALVYADASAEGLKEGVTRFFGGDYYAFVRAYYESVATIGRTFTPDFVAHFDLVTKYNGEGLFFDEEDPRYRAAALDALAAVMERVQVFEINTGGMYRVGRKMPYPAPFILREIRARGGEILLTSDSHDAASMGYRYDDTAELARSVGFRYAKVLTPKGFVSAPL